MMKQPSPKNRLIKNLALVAVLLLLIGGVWLAYSNPSNMKKVDLSDVISRANKGEISNPAKMRPASTPLKSLTCQFTNKVWSRVK